MPYRIAADTIEDLSRAVDECLEQDVLVFSGGSSVGERDLILDVITAQGRGALSRHRREAGQADGLRPHEGQAGLRHAGLSRVLPVERLHPAGAALRRMARLPDRSSRTVTLPLGARVASAPGRHQFYTVRIENGVAVPAFKASGDITSMSQADGYIEIPADVDVVDVDTMVEVKLF